MSGHTPGPWTFCDKHADEAEARKYGMPYFEISSAACCYKTLYVPYPFPKEGRGFAITGILSESDARLIATAPELLGALKSVLAPYDVMGNFGGTDYGHTHEAIASARAVIDKAEGRS